MSVRPIAIVTPIHNRIANLPRFLAGINGLQGSLHVLIVVDDGSSDGSSEYIRKLHPEVVLLRGSGKLWWSGSTNVGIRWAMDREFRYIMTYNDDQECEPTLLEKMLKEAEKHPDAIISPYVFYMDNRERLLSGGIRIDRRTGQTFGVGNERIVKIPAEESYEVDAVPGYAMLIPREVILNVGEFDEASFPQIYMELEFCIRARRHGFPSIVLPKAAVWNDRVDKSYDPIGSRNPGKRFVWLVRSPKSHLNFRQNWNLMCTIKKYLGASHNTFATRFLFRYLIKVLGNSFLPKEQTRKVKRWLKMDRDAWA
jgi:GT2 family glycosyltransferase